MQWIPVNQLLDLRGLNETIAQLRVLDVDPEKRAVALIEVSDSRALPEWWSLDDLGEGVQTGAIATATQDSYFADTRPDSEFSEASRRIRDERWSVIGPLVQDFERRRLLLAWKTRSDVLWDAHYATGKARDKLYKWLRLYWQRGQTVNALLPSYHKCGAFGQIREPGSVKRGRPSKAARVDPSLEGVNVTGDMRKKIERGYKQYYCNKKGGKNQRALTLKEAYQKTLEMYFSDGVKVQDGVTVPVITEGPMPSFYQFKEWGKKACDERELTIARSSERHFLLTHRPVLGSTEHLSQGPGDLFLIDATVGDIYLISSLDPTYVIGRPVIYIVIDHWSQMIVGMYVGLEGPSWLGAMMALENAFTEKVSFAAQYVEEVSEADWPCSVYPRSILADRGEMVGSASDNLVSAFDIQLINTPPFRADFKSLVEKQFRITSERGIVRQPGGLGQLPERDDSGYRYEDAALTIKDFIEVMIRLVLHNNTRRRITGRLPAEFPLMPERNPTPLDLWEWGHDNYRAMGRVMDRERVRVNLLPTAPARATRRGISVHGGLLHYFSETADARGWFIEKAGHKRKKVNVSHDPRDVSKVYLRFDEGSVVEECLLTQADRRYIGKTLEEVMDERDRRKLADANDLLAMYQDEAATNAALDAIAARAAERKKVNLGQGGEPRLSGTREARKNEKQRLRAEQAFTRSDDTELLSDQGGVNDGGEDWNDAEEDYRIPSWPSY